VRPGVERAIGVEFSRWRLEQLAPVAIAALGTAPEKVERRLADFHAPGLEDGVADLLVCDAAVHHAADPTRVAAVAFRLLRGDGNILLFREPTTTPLRRHRDHGIEDRYGRFQHRASGYENFLREAGFVSVRRAPAAGSFRGAKARAQLRPPLSWFDGMLFTECVSRQAT
jgi:SAM-dependent methyltransferase